MNFLYDRKIRKILSVILALVCSWFTHDSLAQHFFAPRVDYPTSGTTAIIETADVDGNGVPDLIVPDNSQLRVYRGTGTGTFFPPQDIALGSLVVGVVISDFNGDSKQDIAAAMNADGDVRIFYGDGLGGFTQVQSIPIAFGLQRMVSGDFNEDGFKDLAVTAFSNVHILLATGSGMFNTPASFTVGNFAIELVTKDFNLDSHLDIAASNQLSGDMTILMGNGAGSFSTIQTLTTGTNSSHVASDDFNSDGIPDIAVSNNDTRFSIFKGTGTGTFSAPQHFEVGSAGRIIPGDFNLDGKKDLAIGNGVTNTVGLFSGDGTGNFTLAESFPASAVPNYFVITDFNTDGLIDLATTSLTTNAFGVFIGVIPPNITSISPSSGMIGDFVTITGTNFSVNQLGNTVKINGVQAEVLMSTPAKLIVVPKNGTASGTISVTVAGYTATSTASFSVMSNFGTMQFASPTKYNVSGLNGRLRETDFNGDGFKDFVVLLPSAVNVFLGDGLGGFTQQPQINLLGVPVDVLAKDINKDNRIDLIVTNNTTQELTIFLGNGDGTFSAGPNYIIGFGPQRVAAGDFNHDGLDDLLITVFDGFNVFFGTGMGTFINLTPYTMGAYPVDLNVSDFNNDGNLDVVIGNGWDPNITVYLGNSNGTFSFSNLITGAYTGDQQIISEDFNGDGKKDLISGLGTTGFSLMLGNGDGTFGTPKPLTSDFARAFHARDVNGDNKTDLIVPNFSTNTLSVFINDGLANFTVGQTISTLPGPGPLLLTNLNGDQLPDLISCSYAQNFLTVRLGVLIPAITSFTPASGLTGTSVTITGINFGATPANNIVYFGATRATVTAASTTQLTVTVPAGATDKLITVTVGGLTGYSAQPFRIIATNGVINAAAFAGKKDFVSPSSPLGMATGDFDRDGKVDVVTANRASLTLNIYRNTSSAGTIDVNTFAAPVTKAISSDPFFVQVGDLDGDGLLDIIVPISSANLISVFRNTSTPGSISFDNSVDFALSGDPFRVVIQDLDGDGKPEIVAPRRFANAISILKNYSKIGGFDATSFAAPTDFATGSEPYDIAVTDFDSDGKPDIVATNNLDASVSVFRNTISACTIDATSFTAKIDFATGSRPYGIAVGDFDVDGKTDIAVASNVGGSTISVLQNTSTGTISFANKVDFTAGTEPFKLAVADVNGDSKPDIAVTNFASNSISVFANTSSPGTITPASFASLVNYSTGINPAEIAIADIDGDQRAEILVTNQGSSTFSILTPIPTITSFNPASGPVGTTVTINGSNFSTTTANDIVYFGTVKANVTAATTTQLTVTVPVGATFEPLSVEVGGMVAYSRVPFVMTFPGGGTINACALGPNIDFNTGATPLTTYIGDLDGDGKADLVTGNQHSNTVSVFRNTSAAGTIDASSFASKVDFAVGTEPYLVVVADIDGDSKLDIITANNVSHTISVLRNTSTPGTITASSFATKVDFSVGLNPYSIAVGDLDADGRPDLVAANFSSNSVSVLKNTGLVGSFTTASLAPKVDFNTVPGPSSVMIRDLDGDGKPDLATGGFFSAISVLRNTTTQGVIDAASFATKVDFTTGTYPRSMAIGDLDADGKPELVFANYNSNTVSVLKNTSSSGSITTGSFAASVDLTTAANPHGVGISDVDGDGKPDIGVAHAGVTSLGLFKNVSTSGTINSTSFSSRIDFTTGTGPTNITFGDLEGDGKPEVVVAVAGANVVSVFHNLVGSVSAPTISSFNPASGLAGTPVIITGTNFSATSANNVVKFNGVAAIVTASTATSITTAVPAGATTGTVTVTVGCSTATSTVNFNVCSTPAAPSVNGASRCGTGTLTLSASGSTPGGYVWYTVASGGAPIPGETNASYFTPSLSSTTTYFVAAKNGACESSRTPVTAVINNVPAAPIVTAGLGCSPSAAITLLASGGTSGQYRWYTSASGGTAIAGQTNGSFTTPTINVSTTYYVSIDNGTCESARVPVLADVKSCLPQIQTATLTAVVGGETSMSLASLVTTVGAALDVNSFTVVVPPVSGAKTSITAGTIRIDYAGIAFAGTDSFTIRACDIAGNCGQQELKVDVQGDIIVFNALSPNGDGKNEMLFVENINLLPDTQQNHVIIFNRWGSIVYEVDNYDNASRVFRGLNNSGEALPAGTYYYRVDFSSGLKSRTGFISLRP